MPKEKQTKRRRKQTTTIHKKNDIAWKPVDVTLVDEGEEDPLDDLNNHYDDPKLQRKAIKELQAEPGEDVAMFYGLEVLDANEYQVVGTGSDRHVIVKKSDIAAAAAAEEKNIEKTSSKKKDKKKGDSVKSKLDEDDADDSDNKKGRSEKREKEKKSKKKKRKREDDDDKNKPTGNMDADGKEEAFNPSQEDIMTIQTKWSSATGGVVLEERLCRSLVKLGYNEPTPIQAATLSASVLGRRNLVGAAPTGSGKTLAFLLPILQYLVELDATKKVDDDNRRVEALILTPTRELAQQICTESERMLPKECVSLTGGIAIVKQIRLLQSKPRIIVATPGRLWAMMSSKEHPHLQELSKTKFLVLDEADRMVEKHCYPQLVQILGSVESSVDEDDDGGDEDDEGMMTLPGIQSVADVTMLPPELMNSENSNEAGDGNDSASDSAEELGNKSSKRQTFIFSATLHVSDGESSGGPTSVDISDGKSTGKLSGAIADLLTKTKAKGQTKIVDFSKPGDNQGQNSSSGRKIQLPSGLSVKQIKCTQRHKDSHLYACLATIKEISSGPSLVFCNSIDAVRRVGSTLQKLGVPVRLLHAHMQQRARFKAVESLQDRNCQTVVVSTDVAARGLDIPSVVSVFHYDIPRSVDTFVHRAGRTARGVGPDAVGVSISLVAPAEDKVHSSIVKAISQPFENVVLDGRLLSEAQERANLASKIVAAETLESKINVNNKWFHENADAADIEIDESMLEDTSMLPKKEQTQLREGKQAKAKLAALLKVPMKAQRFQKFLRPDPSKISVQSK